MLVINVRNVNEALSRGMYHIFTHGVATESRNGPVIEIPTPVATVYRNPHEKVLINKTRDANPFFHLMESLWILAGRDDVKFLTDFNSRMGDYSDDGMIFNAPYGYRMRSLFKEGGADLDQIKTVIGVLVDDPMSRQAVIQIWDPVDLLKRTKDKACNMSVVFSVRGNYLNITVYNRSNDMIWGAYGANAVQFAMLQEYVAGHLGLAVGTYTQVSNNFHVYTTGAAGDLYKRLMQSTLSTGNPYNKFLPEEVECIGYSRMSQFDEDLSLLFKMYDQHGLLRLAQIGRWKSDYFKKVVAPMLLIWCTRKYRKDKTLATEYALTQLHTIKSLDWRAGAEVWLTNRLGSNA